MLSLAEELVILGINKDNGKFYGAAISTFGVALAGAVLLELSFEDKLRVEDEYLSVSDSKTDDPILKSILDEIGKDAKPRKISTWIQRFTNKNKLIRQPVIQRLIDSKYLKEEKGYVLWIFPTTRYPVRNKRAKREMMNRLRSVVLRRDDPDDRMLCLLSLIQACNWGNFLFEKDQRKKAKERIKQMVEKEAIGDSVAKATQQAVQAQVMAVIMMSVMSTTMMTSNN